MNKEALLAYRQHGSTTALIGVLLQNRHAKMVVHSYDMARRLSVQYGLDIDRFIIAGNIKEGLIGCTGPVLLDIPVISL